MRRCKMALTALLLAAALLLGACEAGTGQAQPDGYPDGNRVLFVTDSVENADSMHIWELLQQAAEEKGAEVTLLEVQSQPDKTSAALNQASDGLYGTIVLDRLAGEAATDWVSRNAGYYPTVSYVCLDVALSQTSTFKNVTYIEWNETGVYYLMGALAALHSQTQTVAFLGDGEGERTDNSLIAFYDGARSQREDIRLVYLYMSTSATGQETESAVRDLLKEGADVICTASQNLADGALKTLREEPDSCVLLAGNALRGGMAYGSEDRLLTTFGFKKTALLGQLFRQLCAGGVPSGTRVFHCTRSTIQMQPSSRYPDLADADALTAYRTVYAAAQDGTLHPMEAWNLSDADLSLIKEKTHIMQK